MKERRCWRSVGAEPAVKDHSGRQKTRPAHYKWRHRFNGKANAQIRRSPDQVNRRKCRDNESRRCVGPSSTQSVHTGFLVRVMAFYRDLKRSEERKGGKKKN